MQLSVLSELKADVHDLLSNTLLILGLQSVIDLGGRKRLWLLRHCSGYVCNYEIIEASRRKGMREKAAFSTHKADFVMNLEYLIDN